MAKVSKDGDNYALIEYHCPISMIAKKYPILCETERELFQRVLGVEINREHHLMCGSHKCSYYIQTQMQTLEKNEKTGRKQLPKPTDVFPIGSSQNH